MGPVGSLDSDVPQNLMKERRDKTQSQYKRRACGLVFSAAAVRTVFIMSDLGPRKVCRAGSLRCPAGCSSGASCRARMETGRTVVLYCAPITESLGSHLQTGLGGRTL